MRRRESLRASLRSARVTLGQASGQDQLAPPESQGYFILLLLYDVMKQDPQPQQDATEALPGLQDWLGRGAEPFWMQDVRLAQRRLQEAREAIRVAAREAEGRSESS